MASNMKLGLMDVKEPEYVEEGEYELEVAACALGESRNTGRMMYKVQLNILNPPKTVQFPAPVYENLSLPTAEERKNDPEKCNFMLLRIKRFLDCMGISYNNDGFNEEDAIRATGVARLKLDTDQNGTTRNVVQWPPSKNE